MLVTAAVALVACNGDDGNREFGRAELWVGGGERGLGELEPDTDGRDVRLPVIEHPSDMGSPVSPHVRGIGVGEDGSILFEFGRSLYRVDPERRIERL
ncbi:MAG: hypothetical protein ACRD0U_03680, partial [Acidimicrobiales bacterium]